ncbi:hypothetical protein PM082_011774 [Marasmius tenuissimus]|nr:hypothetical protein PM082_011774 [Marasmius tenuissimus]
MKLAAPYITLRWNYTTLDVCKTLALDFMKKRRTHSTSELSRIRCPVKVIHGSRDLCYPLEYTEELVRHLEDARVDVSLVEVEGAPHFVCIEYGEVINPILHDYIVQVHYKGSPNAPIPPIMDEPTSPWDRLLKEAGWQDGSDLSDDDFIIGC